MHPNSVFLSKKYNCNDVAHYNVQKIFFPFLFSLPSSSSSGFNFIPIMIFLSFLSTLCYNSSPHPPKPYLPSFWMYFCYVCALFLLPAACHYFTILVIFSRLPSTILFVGTFLCSDNFVLKGLCNRIGYLCILSIFLHFGLYHPVLLLPVLFLLVNLY